MNEWWLWFSTGMEHILDVNGYDHILFICLLSMAFPLHEWRKLIVLITAFTLGHCLTLALSVLNLITIRQEYIELLIILTIFTTALLQLRNKNTAKGVMTIYLIICCFGLIHGMGFSYLLKSMLAKDENILKPLLGFNLGIEAGQLIVVTLFLLLSFLINLFHKNGLKYFRISVASLILIISIILLFNRTINLINT